MDVTGIGVDELDNVDRVDGVSESAVVDESEDEIERSENECIDDYDKSVGVCKSADLDRVEDEVVESIDEFNESDELVE